ncbi:unnamed protein product [Ixodes pacificus]
MPVNSFPKQRNVVPRNNITERPTFRSLYQELCQNSYLCPRRTLLSRIPDDDVLDLFVDNIRTDDWKPLLQALRSGGSLRVISFKSSFLSDYPEVVADVTRLQLVRNVQRDVRVPHLFTPTNLRDFCSALTEHMKNNASLEVLKLHGFPFSVVHIQEMSSGLHAATSLTHLSFNGCPLGKQCLEALCQGLRGSTGLRVLSLCGCQVDGAGAEPLGSLLRLQGLRRHGDAWKRCLRDRPLLLDSLGGLARLSLNNSPLGDTGVATLVAALGDDVWVRGLFVYIYLITKSREKRAKGRYTFSDEAQGEGLLSSRLVGSSKGQSSMMRMPKVKSSPTGRSTYFAELFCGFIIP